MNFDTLSDFAKSHYILSGLFAWYFSGQFLFWLSVLIAWIGYKVKPKNQKDAAEPVAFVFVSLFVSLAGPILIAMVLVVSYFSFKKEEYEEQDS